MKVCLFLLMSLLIYGCNGSSDDPEILQVPTKVFNSSEYRVHLHKGT